MADDGLHRRVGMWGENIKTVRLLLKATWILRSKEIESDITWRSSPEKTPIPAQHARNSFLVQWNPDVSCPLISFSLSFASLDKRLWMNCIWRSCRHRRHLVLGGILRQCQTWRGWDFAKTSNIPIFAGKNTRRESGEWRDRIGNHGNIWKSFNHHFPDLKIAVFLRQHPWQQPCSWCALSWGAPHVNHLQVPAEPHFRGSIEEPWHKRDVVAICCNLVSSQPKCFCKWHVCSDVAEAEFPANASAENCNRNSGRNIKTMLLRWTERVSGGWWILLIFWLSLGWFEYDQDPSSWLVGLCIVLDGVELVGLCLSLAVLMHHFVAGKTSEQREGLRKLWKSLCFGCDFRKFHQGNFPMRLEV